MVAALLFMTLDGPFFGVEEWFNQLRTVQISMLTSMAIGLFTKRPVIQTGLAALNLAALAGGALVRFMPGAYG